MPGPVSGDVITIAKALLDSWPIGICYTQFPGTSDPTTLLGGTWTNISSNYAGLFFRAEGGNAAAFNGGVQAQDSGPHTHTFSGQTGGQSADHAHTGVITAMQSTGPGASGDNARQAGVNIGIGFSTTGTSNDHSHAYSGTTANPSGTVEVRPRNQSIRVWQRTA